MAQAKTDKSAYLQLRRDIKAGTPGLLYVFHGEEKYLMEQCIKQMKELLVPDGMEDFNFHTFDGKGTDINDLLEAMDAFPMMSERSMILVTDFDLFGCSDSQKEQLSNAFSDLPEYLCLVFCYDTLDFKIGNGKFQNLVKKVGAIVEFTPMSANDLNDWVRREFVRYGKEISDPNIEYLTFLCGGLLTGLKGEIHKISTYAKEKLISRADIDAVADPVLEARVFDMTNQISECKYQQVLKTLSDLYALNQHPIMIITILGKHFRQLYTARLALESGRGAGVLEETWKIKGWQAGKLMTAARKCSLSWCRKAVQGAGEADLLMKSANRDAEEILTQLLLELANG